MDPAPTAPAHPLLAVLHAEGVTHVVGLPDNTSAPLFAALAADTLATLVTVTREGEAFGLASGLWIGGASPLVLIQSTGLLESGDALRGTAVRMRVPLPVLVTARGYARMRAAGLTPAEPRSASLLARADVDSAALLAEPTLDAWGVPWTACDEAGAAAEAVRHTIARARREERPVALVVRGALE
jgi:sulfopyruvate decarboxylase TPP-binding subunit